MLALAALALPALAGGPARAETEVRVVESGTAVLHLNASLLRELGVAIAEVHASAEAPAELSLMEDPHWAFAVGSDSDFLFRVTDGRAEPQELLGGRIPLEGDIAFRDQRSGAVETLARIEIAPAPAGSGDGSFAGALLLRNGESGRVFFRLVESMFAYVPDDQVLKIHYMNVEIAPEWAERLGRPELAGWSTGIAELQGGTRLLGSEPDPLPEPVASFGDTVDVLLYEVRSLSYMNREGVYPEGTLALSMATTACNAGNYDVPWLAPMAEDHPVIAMALYRLLDGRFEQIGLSDLKHGFFALSNDDCSPCRNPSNGTFLGIGCSDTYGVNNNADRNYLAPRSEVDPFTATWTCLGSHFADGEPDCMRRHGGSGHGPVDHRLSVRESELDLPGAEYFYEGYYLVPRDYERWNNIGSRRFTASWNGTVWQFNTPTIGNETVLGPALERFGELRTIASPGPDDGRFELAVQTTPLIDGGFHYEYALFNFDADLQARSFRIPIPDSVVVTNLGFHDADADAANDWQSSLEAGAILWQGGVYPDSASNALEFGRLFNFRFDASVGPGDAAATLETWKPHDPSEFAMATLGPSAASSVPVAAGAAGVRLHPARPNPASGAVTLAFELPVPGSVALDVVAPTGRLVRSLLNAAAEAGRQDVSWDGADDAGRAVPAGVYYLKLRAQEQTLVRSVTLLR